MNLSRKQKQTHRELRLVVAKREGGGGWTWTLRLVNAKNYIQNQ